jgi:hypothetical protein
LKIDKHTLGLAAEFAVASELCKRNIYAQLTLGLRKRTDILVETDDNFLRIQVKAKQGREWPGVKGVEGEDILILVDFAEKTELERPDFFILTSTDWKKLIKIILKKYIDDGSVKIDEKWVPIWEDSYKGVGLKPEHLKKYHERWDKILKSLGLL